MVAETFSVIPHYFLHTMITGEAGHFDGPPGVRADKSRQETAKPSGEVANLQENFETRRDADGIRDVLVIGNERPGGCPFKCQGCGVEGEAAKVDASANARVISEQVQEMQRRLEENPAPYEEHGYHLCIYNNGNVTNSAELSVTNLELLLNQINGLKPPPRYVSLNSRGPFIHERDLKRLQSMGLQYDIRFILGIETFSEKGKTIYGKPGIEQETEKMFATIDAFNAKSNTRFGMDVGFVFLPEFYTDDRTNKNEMEQGFLRDVQTFVDRYVGRNTPTAINIHPFYPMSKLPYESTASCFDTLMEAVIQLKALVEAKNAALPEHLHASLFIGLNDSGYETPEWQLARSKWKTEVDRINQGSKNAV